jgi:hypothetical protein
VTRQPRSARRAEPARIEAVVRSRLAAPDRTGVEDASSLDLSTFLRGLSLGALVGAAIAGSAIWERRRLRRAALPEPSAVPERSGLSERSGLADGAAGHEPDDVPGQDRSEAGPSMNGASTPSPAPGR